MLGTFGSMMGARPQVCTSSGSCPVDSLAQSLLTIRSPEPLSNHFPLLRNTPQAPSNKHPRIRAQPYSEPNKRNPCPLGLPEILTVAHIALAKPTELPDKRLAIK